MGIKKHQKWLVDFYKQRNWYQYSSFVRINFLIEEVGELSRAVRAKKIGRDHPGEPNETLKEENDNLKEELADVMDQVLILSDKLGIDIDSLIQQSENKLENRFKK